MADKNPNHDIGQNAPKTNTYTDKKTRAPDEMNSHGQTNEKPVEKPTSKTLKN